MHLRHLRLLDFRSWPLLELELEPGVTTLELDAQIHDMVRAAGAPSAATS